ncbi:MAG: hypothetical protein LBB40_04385 [Holophagales bacterium]|nr:hypothetical protein [Holophagales bacterium]
MNDSLYVAAFGSGRWRLSIISASAAFRIKVFEVKRATKTYGKTERWPSKPAANFGGAHKEPRHYSLRLRCL